MKPLVLLLASLATMAPLAGQTPLLPPHGDLEPLPRGQVQLEPQIRSVQRTRVASGFRLPTAAAVAAGSALGIAAGIVIPMWVASDACQETCAGMWVTAPVGSILGGAAGAHLTGVSNRDAMVGSLLGFTAAIGVAVATPHQGGGGILPLVVQGVVAALWAGR